jgi:hypothetical protein
MRWIIPTSGSGTEPNLLEVAMQSIEAPINGMNLYAPRHCRTTTNHGQTPFEAEWMIQVSDAVIDQEFDRNGANDLLKKIAEHLENEEPADGFSITECYDLIHHRPLPPYQQAYENVLKVLSDMGFTVGKSLN